MAEETPAVRNKGLLITSVVLALLVVMVYNWHVSRVRRASRGETVKLIAFRRNLERGERVEVEDLKFVEHNTPIVEGLGDVVTGKTREEVRGFPLNRTVQRDDFLRWSHITSSGDSDRPSMALRQGMWSFTLAINPKESPGQMLSVGDRVALLGKLAVNGPLKTYRIIEGVRVTEIGGVTAGTRQTGPSKRGTSRDRQRSFNSISIEVTPETAEQLDTVLSHVVGTVRLVVMSPERESLSSLGEEPQVAKELRSLTPFDPDAPGARRTGR